MEFLLYFQSEFATISKAPFTFAVGAILIAVAVWALGRFQASEKISNLESRIALRDDKIEEYKRKLEGASPDEAAALVKSLEERLAAFEPRITDVLRQTFTEMMSAEMMNPASQMLAHQIQEIALRGNQAGDIKSTLEDDDDPPISPWHSLEESVEGPLKSTMVEGRALLLVASTDGQSGAIPIEGIVEWMEGRDDNGAPTVVGQVNIPDRTVLASIIIGKNHDTSLPATHVIEIDFEWLDGFDGQGVGAVAGVLMKNEMLVPGTPLIGASARVFGDSFIFALSAAEANASTNAHLISGQWLDLAIVYTTGRNGILSLEKGGEVQNLFDAVFDD